MDVSEFLDKLKLFIKDTNTFFLGLEPIFKDSAYKKNGFSDAKKEIKLRCNSIQASIFCLSGLYYDNMTDATFSSLRDFKGIGIGTVFRLVSIEIVELLQLVEKLKSVHDGRYMILDKAVSIVHRLEDLSSFVVEIQLGIIKSQSSSGPVRSKLALEQLMRILDKM